MPKFFGKKKEGVAPAPTATASTKSDREKLLAERQQLRAQRKEKREARKEAAQPSKKDVASSSGSSKKLTPKLSQEERDQRDAKLGCCYYFTKFLAGAMHFIDFVIGLLAIIYGAVIDFTGDNPATEVAIACIAYGLVLVTASCMGVFGFAYKCCKRCGLLWSMYTAPLITTYYFFLIIYFLADQEDVYAYLEEHKDSMYLNDDRLAKLKTMMPLVYSILAGLAVAELVRYVIVPVADLSRILYCCSLTRFSPFIQDIVLSRRFVISL